MVLGREFEEMCAQMYYRGKMFGVGGAPRRGRQKSWGKDGKR